jgi:hypothetical protein
LLGRRALLRRRALLGTRALLGSHLFAILAYDIISFDPRIDILHRPGREYLLAMDCRLLGMVYRLEEEMHLEMGSPRPAFDSVRS